MFFVYIHQIPKNDMNLYIKMYTIAKLQNIINKGGAGGKKKKKKKPELMLLPPKYMPLSLTCRLWWAAILALSL